MKKTAIIFLLSIYTLACLGVGINQYYCCGKLQSISISLATQKDPVCPMGSATGCCQAKHQFLKVHDNHQAGLAGFQIISPFTALITGALRYQTRIAGQDLVEAGNQAHAPPLSPLVPLYILHRIYRI